MSDESQLRGVVIDRLSPLHAVSIESPMEAGVPDVNFVHGWIELKHLNEYPVRETTPVVPHHFRPQQRNWLASRCLHGGAAWLLLRVGRAVHLVWGASAATHVGLLWTRLDLSAQAWDRVTWSTMPSSADLIEALIVRRWVAPGPGQR